MSNKKIDLQTLKAVKNQASQQITQTKKSSAGRKPKPDQERATYRFVVMLSQSQAQNLEKSAQSESLPVASYIKNLLKKNGSI